MNRYDLIGIFGASLICAAFVALAVLPFTKAEQEQKKLGEVVAALARNGEPTRPGDLASKPVADVENAALMLRAAGAGVDYESRATKAYYALEFRLPLTAEEASVLRAFVAENPGPLAKIDAAMRRPGVDWKTEWKSPMVKVVFSHFNEQRMLVELLKAAAFDAYHRGDHRLAMHRVEQIRFIAWALDEHPMLLSHLVAGGCYTGAAERILQMAPELAVSVVEVDGRAASEKQVLAMADALLDDAPVHAGLRRGLTAERVMVLDTANALLKGNVRINDVFKRSEPPEPDWVKLRPQVLADTRLMLGYLTQLAEVAESPDRPTFAKRRPGDISPEFQEKESHPFGDTMYWDREELFNRDFRLIAEQRMAAVALAVRCYQIDNAGKLPARLGDLVPKYLKAVPLDPMATDRPLGYKSGDKPIVYSVGEDGKDDGGSELYKGQPSENRWQTADAVVRLYRTPRKE